MMRMGLLLSSLLHASLIGFGLFTIAGSRLERHELDIEAVSVDLVPIAEHMALREGEQTAPVQEPPAPKPTQKPEINNQAQHVGDGQVDSAAPLRPEQRPREVEATPPPTGERQAEPSQPAEQAQQADTPPPPEPKLSKPEPTPPVPEVAEAEPAPEPVETVAADEPAQTVQTAPIIPPLPQNVPQPKQKPEPVAAKPAAPQAPATGEKSLDDILNQTTTLIDRTPTQGGGMRRSEQTQGAGAPRNIGDNQQLAQTIQNVIGGCIKRTANIGILTGSRSYDLVVKVHMRLNRDGSLQGQPDLTPSGGEPSEREIAVTQGHAALARCAPFQGLPPERYDDGWFDVTINWRPLEQ